jgi:soluble cytochrome b562
VAALTALRGIGEAIALFTQGDLKAIAKWLETGTLDVRIAAAKLLGTFGADLVAVEALLSRDYNSLTAEDYCASVEALSSARVLKDKVAEFLFSELSFYLDEKRKKTVNTVQQAKSIMDTLKRLRKTAPAALVKKVQALVTDFRIEDEIKYHALLCYPAIAMPSSRTVETVKGWFLHPPLGLNLDVALVQVPSIVARQCRESVDYVMACVGALVDLRKAMVNYHKQISKKDLSDESEYNVTELRRGIDEVTRIIVAFDEFIQNGNTGKDSPNGKTKAVLA